MQRLEVTGAVRPLEWSLGVKGLNSLKFVILQMIKSEKECGKLLRHA